MAQDVYNADKFGNIPLRIPTGMKIVGRKDGDAEPKLVRNARVKVFDLSDEKDVAEYASVMQGVGEGRTQLGAEDRVYNEAKDCFRILLRWWECHYELDRRTLTAE